MDEIKSYKQVNELLQGRCYNSRKLGNNTYLKRLGNNIAVVLHNTIILTITQNDKLVLNTGGWYTVTTKNRINRYLPSYVSLYQENYQWYLSDCREIQKQLNEFDKVYEMTNSLYYKMKKGLTKAQLNKLRNQIYINNRIEYKDGIVINLNKQVIEV